MAVKAEFIGAPVVVDLIESVYFSDLSQGNPTAWFWDFGDGETSTEQNPVHFFPGSFLSCNHAYCVTLPLPPSWGASLSQRDSPCRKKGLCYKVSHNVLKRS
jgi:hypothetical protein